LDPDDVEGGNDPMKRPTYEALLKDAEVVFLDGTVHRIWQRPPDHKSRGLISNCRKDFVSACLSSLWILSRTARGIPLTFCPDCWTEDEIEEVADD